MADPTDGFYIQDKLDDVPNGIVRAKKDYDDMITPNMINADDINDVMFMHYLLVPAY
jgi:hypothetical protein